MAMLGSIRIQNYRSFQDASAQFSPFTLVIGPNGSGKSNLLRVIDEASRLERGGQPKPAFLAQRHYNRQDSVQRLVFEGLHRNAFTIVDEQLSGSLFRDSSALLYQLDPALIGGPEQPRPKAFVNVDGRGAVSVLDELKNGDRGDLFDRIQELLKTYIPSIERISSFSPAEGHKQLQVREKDLQQAFPVSELSEGTRLLLLILTIVHQERAPKIILLEDLDRALHARLFQQVVAMLRSVTRDLGIQIIATAHNPYLVDEFIDHEDAVLLVEKERGESTITSLAERLEAGEAKEDALGSLWFGGFVGAVPKL